MQTKRVIREDVHVVVLHEEAFSRDRYFQYGMRERGMSVFSNRLDAVY